MAVVVMKQSRGTYHSVGITAACFAGSLKKFLKSWHEYSVNFYQFVIQLRGTCASLGTTASYFADNICEAVS
jgi:hypothetical protein